MNKQNNHCPCNGFCLTVCIGCRNAAGMFSQEKSVNKLHIPYSYCTMVDFSILGLHLLTINTFSAYINTPIQCHGNISVWLPSCVLLRCQHGCLVTANKFNNPIHVRKQRCKITYSPSLSYCYIIKVNQSIVSIMACIIKNQRHPINAPLGGEVEIQREIKVQRSD